MIGVLIKEQTRLSSYTYSWTFTSADNGTHNWTARAYDAAGNSSTSSVVSLTVNISTADTTPPTVSITSPSSGDDLHKCADGDDLRIGLGQCGRDEGGFL